jgi:hypothetical protein
MLDVDIKINRAQKIMSQSSNSIPQKKKKKFSQRVATITGNSITEKGCVSVIDLFLGIGWLTKNKLLEWKMGKIPYLERIVTANLRKISKIMKEFKSWAMHSNLKPKVTVYKHKGFKLRFSKSKEQNIEIAYSTHYLLPKPKKEIISVDESKNRLECSE